MKISAEQYATVLFQALQETKPADADKVLDNFVTVLAENGHLGMLAEIETEYLKYESRQKGEVPVQLTYAREGHAEKRTLDELHRLIGKGLAVKNKIDEGLIGGVIVETEDLRLDASVRKQLKNLKDTLSE